jgi:GxxExxY protein
MDTDERKEIPQSQKFDQRTFSIIGAAMKVHRELGHGFLEVVYQKAFACELGQQGLPFQTEVEIPVFYRGHALGVNYRADFVCFSNILIEIKALQKLTTIEDAQVINYLKATGFHTGLLLNFGSSSLHYKRLLWDKNNL